MEAPNPAALSRRLAELGLDRREVDRLYRTFNVAAFEAARGG